MGSFARSFVAGSLVLVAACASIAGLEEPDERSTTGANTPTPSGAPTSDRPRPAAPNDGSSSGSTPDDAGASGDAGDDVEQPPPPPLCQPPKKPADSPCDKPAECCSNACSEDARCRGSCKSSELDLCNPFGDECCIGLYCAGIVPRCKRCRPTGSDPEGGDITSCCARTLGPDGKCL